MLDPSIRNSLMKPISEFWPTFQHALVVTLEQNHFQNTKQNNESSANSRYFRDNCFPSPFCQTHAQKAEFFFCYTETKLRKKVNMKNTSSTSCCSRLAHNPVHIVPGLGVVRARGLSYLEGYQVRGYGWRVKMWETGRVA